MELTVSLPLLLKEKTHTSSGNYDEMTTHFLRERKKAKLTLLSVVSVFRARPPVSLAHDDDARERKTNLEVSSKTENYSVSI